jgi:hypothetical protein
MLYNAIARGYEDLPSLKKYIKANPARNDNGTITGFKSGTISERLIKCWHLTTGTAAEVEMMTGSAIGQIGKTEVAVSLGASTNAASHNEKVFTLVYLDADGVSHTATATGTATLADTQVAFSPAITDFYCATSFTVSADFADQDVFVETTGSAVVWATISNAGTTLAATEAQLLGVGAAYLRGSTDHADSDSKIGYLCYVNPWGTIKYAIGTIGTTGDAEVRFLEATDDGDGTTTVIAGNTTVKDFYRVIWWRMSAAATANTDFLITDADCSNINGSGGDVYAYIPNGFQEWESSRVYARPNYSTWIARIEVTAPVVAVGAATDNFFINLVYQPSGYASITETKSFMNKLVVEQPILLTEGTDFYIEAGDTATAATLRYDITMIEVEDA